MGNKYRTPDISCVVDRDALFLKKKQNLVYGTGNSMPYCEVFCRFPGCSHNICVEHEEGLPGLTNAHAQMGEHEKAAHVCATCGYCPPHGNYGVHWRLYMDKHKQRCVELHGRPTARL